MTVENATQPELSSQDVQSITELAGAYTNIKTELAKVIVGMEEVIDLLLMGILANGHCMLEGVPGLAKTLLISTLSEALSLKFSRIQFTPDLMPSDVTGTEVLQENKSTGERELRFISGPIFTNILLADEINRTGPKTQASLLEAMQEKQVTTGGQIRKLDMPFFVLATMNPIEQEGTYQLPEAQQDRFMFKILVDYPTQDEEISIVRATTAPQNITINKTLDSDQIKNLQTVVRRIPVSDAVIKYATDIVRATRIKTADAIDFVKENIAWGAGPRASQYLILGAKAHAALHGRHMVSSEDVAAVAKPVLRHRILTNYAADAEGITSDAIIEKLLGQISCNESELSKKVESF